MKAHLVPTTFVALAMLGCRPASSPPPPPSAAAPKAMQVVLAPPAALPRVALAATAAATTDSEAPGDVLSAAGPSGDADVALAAKRDQADGAPALAPPPPNPSLLAPERATAQAPPRFRVRFRTTKGDFLVDVVRAWAPNGADRFYNLVKLGYFSDIAIFRVVKQPDAAKDFVAQFGVHGRPEVATKWLAAAIADDPVVQSNLTGTLVFAATNAPNSRSVQMFINYADNSFLDAMGFAPFARVVSGMDVARSFYGGYGEQPTHEQGQFAREGNAFVRAHYPRLDYIQSATFVTTGSPAAPP